MLMLVMFGLISSVFAVTDINNLYKSSSVNRWDVAFDSDYYNGYVTSLERSLVPVKIDFTQREHTLYFYIDNKNPSGFDSYQEISKDVNKSQVTIHLAGADNGQARIISPEDYDPRIPHKVNYNINRRVVVKFVVPEDAKEEDSFEIGLRAKSLEGENRQILLNLVSDYPENKTEETEDNTMLYMIIFVVAMSLIIVLVFVLKSGKKKGDF